MNRQSEIGSIIWQWMPPRAGRRKPGGASRNWSQKKSPRAEASGTHSRTAWAYGDRRRLVLRCRCIPGRRSGPLGFLDGPGGGYGALWRGAWKPAGAGDRGSLAAGRVGRGETRRRRIQADEGARTELERPRGGGGRSGAGA